jgi:hypothetical protein
LIHFIPISFIYNCHLLLLSQSFYSQGRKLSNISIEIDLLLAIGLVDHLLSMSHSFAFHQIDSYHLRAKLKVYKLLNSRLENVLIGKLPDPCQNSKYGYHLMTSKCSIGCWATQSSAFLIDHTEFKRSCLVYIQLHNSLSYFPINNLCLSLELVHNSNLYQSLLILIEF